MKKKATKAAKEVLKANPELFRWIRDKLSPKVEKKFGDVLTHVAIDVVRSDTEQLFYCLCFDSEFSLKDAKLRVEKFGGWMTKHRQFGTVVGFAWKD